MVRRGVETGGRRRKSRGALTSRPEVKRLLDAASAPASPRELAGEHAAVALFARAPLVASVPEAGQPVRSSRVGFKAAAASVAAVIAMSSGVSFAATGHVPFADTFKKVTGQNSDKDAASDRHKAGDKSDGSTSSPNGPKAAALHGLCQAYHHGQKVTHGHALEQRPFTTLVTAAGGEDQVADFCASLPPKGQQDGDGTPTHPTHPTHPTTGPSTDPSEPGEPSKGTARAKRETPTSRATRDFHKLWSSLACGTGIRNT